MRRVRAAGGHETGGLRAGGGNSAVDGTVWEGSRGGRRSVGRETILLVLIVVLVTVLIVLIVLVVVLVVFFARSAGAGARLSSLLRACARDGGDVHVGVGRCVGGGRSRVRSLSR